MSATLPANRSRLAYWGLNIVTGCSALSLITIWLYLMDMLPQLIRSQLPDPAWFGIWFGCTLFAPALFSIDWNFFRCNTILGKACIYINLPVSSVLYLLGLPQLLPTQLQQRLNPYVLMGWEGLSLLILAPMALWWENRSRSEHLDKPVLCGRKH